MATFWEIAAHSVFSVFLTAVSGVGSNPALATCETRQVLLAESIYDRFLYVNIHMFIYIFPVLVLRAEFGF